MFTGIIQQVIRVIKTEKSIEGLVVTFEKPTNWQDLQIGESIATNGVCLTIAKIVDKSYECIIMPETLQVSTFGLDMPSQVNVERSLKISDRISGHIVQGHIDGIGEISEMSSTEGRHIYIKYDKKSAALIVLKGSIAIDGVSLTIASVNRSEFSVAIIPYTLQHTTFGELKIGIKVNLEFDILGKYVQRNIRLE